jgi:hypothetical protein
VKRVALVFVRALLVALAIRGLPASADSSTDVGLFGAVVSGSHVGFDNPVPESGVVPGAALEVTQRYDRVRLHLEGIPTVAATGSARGPFGSSSASLSLLNSTVMVDLDAHHVVRVGAGYQFVTLTYKNGNNGDRNDVRIASPIYAIASTVPLRPHRFVEAQLLVDPNLRGDLLAFDYLGRSRVDEPERGAEIDYGAGYGIEARRVTYVIGVRGLSYHTRNASTGTLVDRNVGGGVTFEARFHVGNAKPIAP